MAIHEDRDAEIEKPEQAPAAEPGVDRCRQPHADRKTLSVKQKRVIIGLSATVVLVFAFAFIFGAFTYSSICDKCGATRHATDWRIPLTDITVFTRSTVSDSPLSRVVLANGMVPEHPHQWLFEYGSGNGVLCAIGRGRHIRPAADSEKFAALVLALHQHGQTDFRDRVVRGALDRGTSHIFRSLSFRVPETTMSATELRDWVAEQSEYLDESITAYDEMLAAISSYKHTNEPD